MIVMVKKIIVLLCFYFVFTPSVFSHCGDCGVGGHKKKDRASCDSNKSEKCSKKQCSHDKNKEAHKDKANTVDGEGESSQGEEPQSSSAPALKQESK
ncbi:MAG: hypothetical protein F4X95_03645 [Oligoflexia bacterium]|nr:hypothetical protein [Oligoflexia bacterium]